MKNNYQDDTRQTEEKDAQASKTASISKPIGKKEDSASQPVSES